jgi:hypothetical protein
VLRALLATLCVALSASVVLNPDAAQLVLVVVSVALVAIVVASSCAAMGTAWNLQSGVLGGVADAWSGPSVTGQARAVVRLVLLSQPRR